MNPITDEQNQDIPTESVSARRGIKRFIANIILCILIIGVGVVLKSWLTSLREPPMLAELPTPEVSVEVKAVQPEEVPVIISGYGEVHAADSVAVTPKVAGEVVYLHPNLEVGKVIPKGELLYRIDQRDYLAAQAQGRAQIERLEIMVKALKQQYESDTNRLQTIKRARDIAQEEFNRDKTLLQKDDVGSESMVNLSEINYRKAQDAFDQVQQAIDLYPLRIKESEAALRAGRSALELADLALERTEEYAPFNARIQHKQIEVDQAVAPGLVVLLLADDSILEVSVPLDSRDAQRWIPFLEEDPSESPNWFRPVAPASCVLSWTEDPSVTWTGTLDRVERFDPMTRTVTVAIRVTQDTRPSEDQKLPLVEGMFCKVEITGNAMRAVYRLPEWAVSYEGMAYLAEDNHLRRVKVNVVRSQDEEVFVDSGLSAGDLVVLTRLVDPVPGILLKYELPDGAVKEGEALLDHPSADKIPSEADAPSMTGGAS